MYRQIPVLLQQHSWLSGLCIALHHEYKLHLWTKIYIDLQRTCMSWWSWVSCDSRNSEFIVMESLKHTLSQKTIMHVVFSSMTGTLEIWQNPLLQKECANSNGNIWLNIPWSFSPQLDAFSSHLQVSGCVLDHPSWQNRCSPTKFVDSHRLVSSAQSTGSQWG